MTFKAVVFDAYGTLYDTQSVASVTDEAFPGYGELITQIWRIKQLEYTWLRSLMRCYEDFSGITRDSLRYTLRVLGLRYDEAIFERIMNKYVHLDLDPEARPTLLALKEFKRAILSNGSTNMLTALIRNTGLDDILDTVISADLVRTFKPSLEVYSLIESHLNVERGDILFVSSNPWDAIGAKAAGLKVAWIERVTSEAVAKACLKSGLVTPSTMFNALRMQMDELGCQVDYRIKDLPELCRVLSRQTD